MLWWKSCIKQIRCINFAKVVRYTNIFRASVLSEVQTSRSSQLPASKNLLVLGDKESGKTTLVAKLQGNEDPKKGAGLEYGYIDVRDEYRDGNFSPESYYFDQLI